MSSSTVIIFVTPERTGNLDELHAFLDDYYELGYDFEEANYGTRTKARMVSINDPALPTLWYNSRYGGKVGGVYIGTFKGLNEEDFAEFVRTTDWEWRDHVQVFMQTSRDRDRNWRFEEIAIPEAVPDRCAINPNDR